MTTDTIGRERVEGLVDIVINEETGATVRVRVYETYSEVIDAWHGPGGEDAMAALDAFGVDILSMFEAKITEGVK